MTDYTLRARSTKANGTQSADAPLKADDRGALVTVDKYQELALRGKVFTFSRAAVTITVNAANLVSVFGVYNPPGSGVFLDLIDAQIQAVLATTVVGGYGLYYSTPTLSAAATFTTQLQSAVENARVGEGAASGARAYSAVTHSGTPALLDLIGGHNAVTGSSAAPIRKEFKGRILVPPGILFSLASTTTVGTTSGNTAVLRWAEIPYVGI